MALHAKLSPSERSTATGADGPARTGAAGVGGGRDGDPGAAAAPYVSRDFHSIPARLLRKEDPALG